MLTEKPSRNGFQTDLWMADREAHLIRKKFEHPSYLRELMSKWNLTPQKSAKRAKEGITRRSLGDGRTLGQPCKKRGADHAHLELIDESGLFFNPLVRRTWAPRGGR